MFDYFKDEKYIHRCQLIRTSEGISEFITEKYRKRIKQWFLVSPNEKHRQFYIKSSTEIRNEKLFNLRNHFLIIHPFSEFRYYWELFMIIVYILELITVPYFIVLQSAYFYYISWFILTLQFITASNIVVQLFTAFKITNTTEIVFKPKKIFKNYLCTYLIPDILASFPISFFILYQGIFEEDTCKYLLFLIVLNICSLLSYTEKIREKRCYYLCAFRFFQWFLVYILSTMWLATALNIAVKLDSPFKIKQTYIFWLEYVFRAMQLMANSRFCQNGYEMHVDMVIIIFGLIIKNILLAYFIILLRNVYLSKRKCKTLSLELNEFNIFKQLSIKDGKRILNYYNYKFQNKYYNESKVWSFLPDLYKYKIKMNMYASWFESEIFKSCTSPFINSMLYYLKEQIYLLNDVIYRCESKVEHIYFLRSGTIAFFDATGIEMFHIEEGKFFSDFALILTEDHIHMNSAIAVESCEVIQLHREDFRIIINRFPEHYDQIISTLKNRQQIFQESSEDI